MTVLTNIHEAIAIKRTTCLKIPLPTVSAVIKMLDVAIINLPASRCKCSAYTPHMADANMYCSITDLEKIVVLKLLSLQIYK